MATGSNEDNPYRSPAASGTRTAPTRGGVWPLIVPVGLLYFYGALVVLYGASFLYMLLGGCSLSDGRTQASDAQVVGVMFGLVVLAIHGCFAIANGRYLWKRRWRRSAVAFAVAMVLAIIVGATIVIVNRLPPGKPLLPQSPAGQLHRA